jgi:anti-anti-sigma factor
MLTEIATIQQQANRVVVTPTGPGLSGPEVAQITATLTMLIDDQPKPYIVFEMIQIERLDSSSLGALVVFFRRLTLASGRIVLACCHPSIAALFELTRLDTIMPLLDDASFAEFQEAFIPATEDTVAFEPLASPAAT